MSTNKITQPGIAGSMLRHPAGKRRQMIKTYRVAYKIDNPAAETKIATILIIDGYSTLADATKIIGIPLGIDAARIKIIGTPKMIKAEPQS